jgi:hypothetical protein
MFLVRFLVFSLAMLFSYLQAEAVRERPFLDHDHTIKTQAVTTIPKNNGSHLVGLVLAHKDKASDSLSRLDQCKNIVVEDEDEEEARKKKEAREKVVQETLKNAHGIQISDEDVHEKNVSTTATACAIAEVSASTC